MLLLIPGARAERGARSAVRLARCSLRRDLARWDACACDPRDFRVRKQRSHHRTHTRRQKPLPGGLCCLSAYAASPSGGACPRRGRQRPPAAMDAITLHEAVTQRDVAVSSLLAGRATVVVALRHFA